MKKLIIFVTALAALLLMSTSAFAADGRMVMIPAGFVEGKHYTIETGKSYPVIGFSYIAAEQVLVQEFISKVDFTVTFLDTNGNVVLKLTPDVIRQLWSEPSRARQSMYNISPQSRAFWKVPLSVLPVGDYEMHTVVDIPAAISNNLDCDCDGRFDVFTPEEYNKDFVVYIHIVD